MTILYHNNIKISRSYKYNIGCIDKYITIINDSYNASPDSVKSSVSVLKTLAKPGRNIVVIADMLELGEKSPKIHFETEKYITIEVLIDNLNSFSSIPSTNLHPIDRRHPRLVHTCCTQPY